MSLFPHALVLKWVGFQFMLEIVPLSSARGGGEDVCVHTMCFPAEKRFWNNVAYCLFSLNL